LLRRHTEQYPVPDRATLLALVDNAALKIATGYAASSAAAANVHFGQAIASLSTYGDVVAAQRQNGVLSEEAVTYLAGEASELIAELQKL
jgi:hypothetical protein